MAVLHNLQFARLTDQLGRVADLPATTIALQQQQRLRRLIDHARQHSAFYRRRFSGLPDELTLQQIPPTTKDELREHFDDVVTDRRIRRRDLERFVGDERNLGQWYLGQYAVCHTSGSQGPPLLIVQDRQCLRIILATMAARGRPGPKPGIREGLRRIWKPTRVAAIAFRRGFYPSGMTLEFTQDALWPFARISRFSSIQPDLIERLNELQPNVISGYASVLEGLAIQASDLRLGSLEYITNSSEQLSQRAKFRIESAFQVPVVNHYGTGECLQLADGCPLCGDMHVNADWAILEVVDDDYRPVPAGQVGSRVLITNLANMTQPFIRYEVTDRVALRAEGAGCPNPLPRIERIDGREAELFWVRDGDRDRFLSGILFHSAADSLHVIREWRAVQRSRNEIRIEVVLLPGTSLSSKTLEEQLTRRLYDIGLPRSVSLQVGIVDQLLPDPRTGKMRRMVTELDRSGHTAGATEIERAPAAT